MSTTEWTKIFDNMKKKAPLVHFITNYVTVNDVANMLLACGGSPIMSDELPDVEDITAICNATVLNIGTLNRRTVEAMHLAGKKANALGHPVILDPVGAGASAYRTQTAVQLMKDVKCAVIRGNISEIKTLFAGSGTTKGVDADVADRVTDENLHQTAEMARELSRRTGAVIAITGVIDVIADDRKAYAVRNGCDMMSAITGTGCMLDGVIAAYVAANTDCVTEATAAAIAAEGLCGERARDMTRKEQTGYGSFHMHLIDCMGMLREDDAGQAFRIEEVQ